MKKLFLLFVALLLSTSTLVGQNDPIAIHPFETRLGAITADTLNIHLSVPVIKKTGIGLPFSYDLVFNNNFWTPNGSQWSPGGEIAFGWSQMGAFRSGVLTGSRGELCADNVHHDKIYNQFVDPRGIAHPIPGAPITVTCGPPQTVLLTDGSGVTVTLASDTQGITVATYPDGTVVTPYTSIKDVNGNAISVTSNGTFPFTVTDTLNVPELTISDVHSLYGNSQFTYTYPAPNSTTASVVQNLSLYTVQTNFGCAAHTDYGPFPNFYLLNNIVLPDGSQYSFTYEQTPGGAAGNVTGRLASVTLPTGGIIRYTYTGPNNGINCTDGTTAGLTATTSDGPTTYVRDTTNWNQTTVTQASGDYAIYNFAAKNPGLGPFYEVQRRFYASDGTLKLTETACYNGNQTNCGSVTTAPSLQINQIDKYTLIAGKSAQSRSTTLFDAYNNVTDTKAYDFVCTTAATPVCTAPRSETVITYGSYSSGNCVAVGNGIVNKPCKIQNKNGSNTVAETHMTYNATGHPTATAQLVSGTTYLTINATYNANGTVATVTDPNNALTTIHYDGTGGCNNGLATSTGYPLNLADSMTWDCNGGVPLVYTDVNSNTLSVLSYDSMWRPLSAQDQAGIVTNLSYSAGGLRDEKVLTFNGGTSTSDSVLYRDSLGRKAQSQVKRGPSATQYNTISYRYDANGRLNGVSVPCQVAANVNCTGGFNTQTYDALNRPYVSTSAAGGTATNTYQQNDVLSVLGPAPSGEVVKQKQYEYDGLGRLTSVCEITTSSGNGTCAQAVSKVGYWTRYQYDSMGRIVGVCQKTTQPLTVDCVQTPSSGQQTRILSYDGLGRKLSETNPESGTVNYTYDSASGCSGTSKGDLIKRVDARGAVTCYTYDNLHRVLTTSYSDGTPTKTFVYDAATVNGSAMSSPKGRLVEAYTGPSSGKITDEGFSYAARGEQADFFESTPHSSGYYDVSKTYWDNRALKTLSGVGLPTITYNADAMGRPTTVTTSGADPLTSTTYDVAGRVTALTFGSGDTANFTFNNNSSLMTSYKETINGSAVSGTLTWSANGELQQNVIVDPFNSANAQTCSYDYDDIARISAVNCGTPWSQTFTYDAFGNLTKSGSLNWQPGYSATTNRYTLAGTSYDANGNLLNDTFHTYTWDAENKPKTIDTTTLIYDAFGNEVEKQSSGTYTEFVPKFAIMNGQMQLKAFVLLPGGAKARYVGGTISGYLVPDWMGSMRIGSKATQAYDFSLSFASFGERYAVSGGSTYEFGLNPNNTVSDEYDADNRKMQTSQGRWISPDPAGLSAVSPANPQSWNRYSYALNDPNQFTDPSGQYPQDQHEFFTLMLADFAGRADALELAQGARDADNFWHATGLPGLSYFFGLGLAINYRLHFGQPPDTIGFGEEGGFDLHLIEDNGDPNAPHSVGVLDHIWSNLMGHSVDKAAWASGGFVAAGLKLGLTANSPVFGLLEWARLNINAGSLTIVGISIQRWSGNVTNTIQSGDTYLTDATLAMSMDDGKGNIINIWQKDATGGSGSFANVVVDGMSLGDPSVFGSDFFNPPEVK